jgi:hypothetical protein
MSTVVAWLLSVWRSLAIRHVRVFQRVILATRISFIASEIVLRQQVLAHRSQTRSRGWPHVYGPSERAQGSGGYDRSNGVRRWLMRRLR